MEERGEPRDFPADVAAVLTQLGVAAGDPLTRSQVILLFSNLDN